MAVYTKINFEELESHLKNYSIGKLVGFEEIKEGVENSNFKIITQSNSYILTIYEKRVSNEDLPYFINLMSYLSERNKLFPKPFKNNFGDFIQKIKNKNSAIISILPGKQILLPSNKNCFELGKTLSAMHLSTVDFKHYRANSLGQNSWNSLFENCMKSKNNIINEKDKELINHTLEILNENWPKNLTKGQIHADLFTDNVFFKDGNVSGIIDFYFSCTDFLAYDLAVCINDWCFDKEGNYLEDNALSLIEGYELNRKLEKNEEMFLPLLVLGASLRFYLTRLYDWMNTPKDANVIKKSPIEYLNKIKINLSKL